MILLAIALAIGAAALAWLLLLQTPSVLATRVGRGPVAEVVYATGFVEPRNPVEVASRITAPVMAVLVDEGDRVRRGEALAALDAEDQRLAVAQLTAQRLNAEQDEQRALALFQRGFLAKAALDRAVGAAASARAAEAAARARLDQFVVRSGVSGVILKRNIEPGDLASPSKTIFELGDPARQQVTATVDERDIPLVKAGAAAVMSSDAFPGRVFRGRVREITPGGDPDQRAFRIRIDPDAGTALPIGLTVEVNVLADQRHNALLVPGSAVRGGSVWIVEDGRIYRRAVRTGIRGPDKVEIVAGLAENSCIVAKPSDKFQNKQRVSPEGC